MKKRGNKKFLNTKSWIIILIIVNIALASVIIDKQKVIEADKGALYNLGKIFSFSWFFEGAPVVKTSSTLGNSCQIDSDCPPDNCMDNYCLTSYSMLTNYCRQYYCNQEEIIINPQDPAGTISNPDYHTCQVDYARYVDGMHGAEICCQYSANIPSEEIDSNNGCVKNGYQCVTSSEGAYCEYCGDESKNGFIYSDGNSIEECDSWKGVCSCCLANPEEPAIECSKNEDCFATCGESATCDDKPYTLDGEGSLSEASLFASETGNPTLAFCNRNCKCQLGTYDKVEKTCSADKKSINIKTTPKQLKYDTVTKKCVELDLTIKESTENCGVCQRCGNYPLASSATLDSAGPFPYRYPQNVIAGPITIPGVSLISIENDDVVDHTYNVQVVNGASVSVVIDESSTGTIATGTKKDIKYYVMVMGAFCGNDYAKIIINFPGKQYVYQMSYYMKSDCKCGAKNTPPPVECVNSINPNDPKDTAGLGIKFIDPQDSKKIKVCRWGQPVDICSTLQSGFDFFAATGISMSQPNDLNEQQQQSLVSQACQCYANGQTSSADTNSINLLGDTSFSISYPDAGSAECYYETNNGKKSYYLKNSAITGTKNLCDLINNCLPAPTPKPQPSQGSSSGGGGSSSSYSSTVTITSTQLTSSAGTTKTFSSGQEVNIQIPSSTGSGENTATETHLVSATVINLNQVEVTIMSEPQKKIMNVGDEWKVDINKDDIYDLYLKLDKIVNNKPVLSMKAINEPISNESFETPAEEAGEPEKNIETPQPIIEENLKSSNFLIITAIVIIVCVALLICKPWKKKVKRK